METTHSNSALTANLIKPRLTSIGNATSSITTIRDTKKVQRFATQSNGVVAQIQTVRQVNSELSAISAQVVQQSPRPDALPAKTSCFSRFRAKFAEVSSVLFPVFSAPPGREINRLVAQQYRTTTEWNRAMGTNFGQLHRTNEQHSDAANERINRYKLCGM